MLCIKAKEAEEAESNLSNDEAQQHDWLLKFYLSAWREIVASFAGGSYVFLVVFGGHGLVAVVISCSCHRAR
jgi:hypothetical protein